MGKGMQPSNTTRGVASSFSSVHFYQGHVGGQWEKALSNPHWAWYGGLGNAICKAEAVGVQLVGRRRAGR